MGRGPRGSMEDRMETKKMKLSTEQIKNLIKEELRSMFEEEGGDPVEDAADEVIRSLEYNRYKDLYGQHQQSDRGMDKELKKLDMELDDKKEEIEKKFNLNSEQIDQFYEIINKDLESY